MIRSVAITVITGFLLFSAAAIVQAEQQTDKHSDAGHSTAHEKTQAKKTEVESSQSHEESTEGHVHGEVEESPPNLPVLSAFGAINAVFLIYGLWNKVLRKQEGTPV